MDNLGLGLGAGVIEPWPSDYVQENATGQSASIINIDWELLSNAPNTVTEYEGTLAEVEGTGSISGIKYYGSSYDRDREVPAYLEGLGLPLDTFPYDENKIYKLPFGNMFQGFKLGTLDICALYRLSEWDAFDGSQSKWYSMGGNTSLDRYWDENTFFYVIATTSPEGNPCRGFIGGCLRKTEEGTFDMGSYNWFVWDISKASQLLGTFTTGEVPKDENPQTGPASLPIGWAADVVNKYKDEVVIPDAPTLGVSTAGFVNVYEITPNALQGLAAALFRNYEDVEIPEFPDTTQNVNDILKLGFKVIGVNSAVMTNINKQTLDSKYLDYIIDCHIIPVRPNVALPTNLSIGGRTIYKQGNPVLQDYIDFNCGSISIGARYNNQFDFTNVSYKLYLPFIGFVTLNPSYCSPVDASKPVQLGVKYRFNVIDGSCLAFVTSSVLGYGTNSVIGIYSGSCCVHMPITGSNYNSMISGMLNIASIGAQAVKNPLSLLGNAGNLVDSVDQATHPSFESSNSYNASSAFMGVRYPYLVIERPTQAMPQNFFEREGARLNARKRLGDLKGYAKCINADVHFAGPDKDEKEEIKALLESGIYL